MNIRNNVHPNLSLLLLCIFLRFFLSWAESDTISANQSLSGDQTIVSKGGSFELGFFKPGNRSNYYIGIWYKKISLQFPTIVWVANRETPVSDKYSSHLTIQNGNLVLLNNNNSKFPIWSTSVNVSSSSVNVIATLLNNGNLKLIDRDKDNGIWESFENPSHTWLPGGKLSYNKITKRNHLLISWKNSEDPAPGLYSLELNPSKIEYNLKWNMTKTYWSSGKWNRRIFELIPEMIYNHRYNFTFIDNVNESYFTYTDYDPRIISRLTIELSGRVNQYTWLDNSQQWNMFWAQPRRQCDVYAYCGPFGIGICNEESFPSCDCLKGYKPKFDDDWNIRKDFSGGCVRKMELQCDNNDKFWKVDLVELPEDPEFLGAGNVKECESACLKNCSCKAYAYDNETHVRCSIWNWNKNRELLNLRKPSPVDGSIGKAFYLRLAESEFSREGKNMGKLMVGSILAGSIVLALFLVGLVVWILIFRRQKRRRTGRLVLGNQGSIMAFTYKELQIATKNFSEKLGGGGFGSVFRGTLPDSSIVAVKKLESVSQGEKQFRMEVSTIGTIQHINLIRLRGFCSEGGDKKLLVYDYMENGSLDFHLFQGRQQAPLDWKTRYQIALGTARGLAYLHDKCRDCIIHCDIKPENILLDSEFCPKVADFGLAKLVGRDFSRVLTTIRGTRGYLAPEWISGVPVTAKTDVYSYGMMIFEFISGKRNINSDQYSNSSANSITRLQKYFPLWAGKVLVDGGDVLGLLDPRLNREADEEEVSRLCRIGCWCIQDEENRRPSMGQVVQMLERVLPVNLLPPLSLPRSLLLLGYGESEEHEHGRVIFFTESSSSSDHTSSGGKCSMTSSLKGLHDE